MCIKLMNGLLTLHTCYDQVEGVYGVKAKLPAVGGNEGLGEVVQVSFGTNCLALFAYLNSLRI